MPFKKADPSSLRYARRVRLVDDPEQCGFLDGQSKICNWLWNRLKDEIDQRMAELSIIGGYGYLDEDRVKQILNEVYSEIGLRNLVPQLKAKYPFLRCVFSSPLKNVALRMAKAIAAHKKSKNKSRRGPEVGWIKYQSWAKQWTSIEYDEPGKGWDVSQFGWLGLSFGVNAEGQRLGVRMKMVNPPSGIAKARTCRIVREGRNRYFAVFTFAKTKKKEQAPARAVYIDPNHKNFGYGLDAEGRAFEIANLESLKQSERMLDKMKSRRDRCTKKSLWVDTVHADGTTSTYWRASRRWHRLQAAVERLERKDREQKKGFLYGLANALCRHYDLIGVGDYVPENADHGRGRRYNRAVRNRTLHGSFKKVLPWVAAKSGKSAVVLDESGTTRTCHVCHHVVAGGIHPKVREWQCEKCGAHHHRDENACQNGLPRLLAHAGGAAGSLQLPCSGPVVIRQRCDWRYHPTYGWREVPQGSANVNLMHPPETRRQMRRNTSRNIWGGDHASRSIKPVLVNPSNRV